MSARELTAPLAVQISDAHDAAQASIRDAVAHAIRAGELLLAAKDSMPHGAFGAFCGSLPFKERTARGYMRLARLDTEKRQRVADFSIRRALQDCAQQKAEQHDPAALAAGPAFPWLPATLPYELPYSRDCSATAALDDGRLIVVDPAAVDGHYFIAEIDASGDTCRTMGRPVRRDAVGLVLREMRVPVDVTWHRERCSPLERNRWGYRPETVRGAQ